MIGMWIEVVLEREFCNRLSSHLVEFQAFSSVFTLPLHSCDNTLTIHYPLFVCLFVYLVFLSSGFLIWLCFPLGENDTLLEKGFCLLCQRSDESQ